MPGMEPSPQTTLVILLGASEWPVSSLQSSPAFARSANRVRDYFCHPHLFGLPSKNWLDLFDQRQNNPYEVDQAIGTFLDERIWQMKQTEAPARDLLFYYIGHGLFAYGHDQAYYLAIHSTRDDSLRASSVAMASLAETLKAKARYLRRIVTLDCCFAAESFKYMQSAPDQVAIRQTTLAFEEKSKGRGYPGRGTALLCSSGHKQSSLILRDESGTMFSEALVRALSLGNKSQPDKTHLSLYDLKLLTEEMLESFEDGSAPKPEVHSPDQSDGDVASVPFFPNSRTEEKQVHKAKQMPIILQSIDTPPIIRTNTLSERALFTVLDIGTTYARAIIIEIQDDMGIVLGVGQCPQSFAHMSDSVIIDITGVIANCTKAIRKAQKIAGGISAPVTIIGITGELVTGRSTTVSCQRQQPAKPITMEELESLIASALQHLLKNAKEHIAEVTGYHNIDVRLVHATVVSVHIDGHVIANPNSVGSKGSHVSLTLFGAFAPLVQLGAIETIAQGLDLTLVNVVSEPYALARCLSANAEANEGAIFIDIGGATTGIALVRQGGVEEIRTFNLGGRTFTRCIAASKGMSLKDAERLKINYSNGDIKGSDLDEIRAIVAPECQNWMDSVELLIDELAKGEHLPPAIYVVGGGTALADIHQRLESFPWTERLPFLHQPIIRAVQPDMVASITDREGLLVNAQDITSMALAYQAIELQNENNVLERALDHVICAKHL